MVATRELKIVGGLEFRWSNSEIESYLFLKTYSSTWSKSDLGTFNEARRTKFNV